MKILQITASYKPAYIYGGPTMSVAKLCEEVGGRRSEGSDSDAAPRDPLPLLHVSQLEVYTTLANGAEELDLPSGSMQWVEGVKVRYFKRITKDHSHLSPALLFHLWRHVREYEVVHIHAWWNLVTMPACLIALLMGKKVLITPRGTLSAYSFSNNNSRIKGLFHQLLGKRMLNNCYFHVTSEKEATDSEKLFQPRGLFNIPNFVTLPWHKELDLRGKSPVLRLLFLSRIERKKGLALLFAILPQLSFPWKLDIVGNGEEAYIESLKLKAESLGLQDHIHWLGPVFGEEKFNLMASYDYLILPSFDENFANVVIESLFAGTPVIITKNVGLSDYVAAKNLGVVCLREEEDLIHALNKAAQFKQEEQFPAKRLNTIIREDFEESVILKRYLNCYQEIINVK